MLASKGLCETRVSQKARCDNGTRLHALILDWPNSPAHHAQCAGLYSCMRFRYHGRDRCDGYVVARWGSNEMNVREPGGSGDAAMMALSVARIVETKNGFLCAAAQGSVVLCAKEMS